MGGGGGARGGGGGSHEGIGCLLLTGNVSECQLE